MQTNRQESGMGSEKELLREALALTQGDAKSWLHASQHCKRFAKGRTVGEKAELNLLRAVFLERSKLHKVLCNRIVRQTDGETTPPLAIDPLSHFASPFVTPEKNI